MPSAGSCGCDGGGHRDGRGVACDGDARGFGTPWRYDEHRVRQRLQDSFSTEHTSIISVIDCELEGCVTLRLAEGRRWLEHFYLVPRRQDRGIGSVVLRVVLERSDALGVAVGLNVLRGSAARQLYERHGFRGEAEDSIDVPVVRLTKGVLL